jgi:hypothetical protein
MSDYPPEVAELIGHGDIEECPVCGALSAYAWCDTNISEEERGRIVGELDYTPELPLIYHIGACSAFEWTCGKCEQSFMIPPINDPCYTHSED